MQSKGKTLVTGATGYIAAHIIKQLLNLNYSVVGTVRSLQNKEKYSFLYDFSGAKDRLQLRQGDLTNSKCWEKAVQGVENVIHVASPIPPGLPKDENDLIKPAVEGTQNVISACLKNKVKRLIFTSSCLTLLVRKDNKVCNEDDWSD